MSLHNPRRIEQFHWLLDHWRFGVPVLFAMFCLIAMTAPIMLPVPVMPHLALLAVLVWSLFQPRLMPPWTAFLIGLVTDLALALPLGMNATLLPLLTLAVAAIDRRFGHRSFNFDWLAAAALILVYEMLAWQLVALRLGPQPFVPFGLQAATTILSYPVAAAACARVQRRWALK